MKRNRWRRWLSAVTLLLLMGCQAQGDAVLPASAGLSESEPVDDGAAQKVTLNVVSTYATGDGNAHNFAAELQRWSAATGNEVADSSAVSDESFKAQVLRSFREGTEPDVLFYFSGVDANPFVAAGQVVSLDEIRAVYPNYASNMKAELMGISPVDGRTYSVPVNGYWEGLFVNKEVLAACGVALPGPDYTWVRFLSDCAAIQAKGYTPIAVSLAHVPHYLFEYSIYNHLAPATHNYVPALPKDGVFDSKNIQYQAWLAGLRDIKALYDGGYLAENTLTGNDDDTFALFTQGDAAFLVDGSWKVGAIEQACGGNPKQGVPPDPELLNRFTVTYMPGTESRKATDIISGLSAGYYITRKAWDDPEKRAVAVSFVSHMTTDAVVSRFAQATGFSTALLGGPAVDESAMSSLALDGLAFIQGTGRISGAVQDQIPTECLVPLFDGMPDIVVGNISAEDAVQGCLTLLAQRETRS